MVMEKEIKTRNSSIDFFRYICAILVVAIHTKPLGEFSELLQNIVIVIARVGVPFFFAVAGYFYIQKLEKGQKPFWGYLKKLLGTYTLWSLFYFAVSFVVSRPANIIKYVTDCAVDFVINGSCYHFWFFPALIFAVSLTTLLYRLKWQKVIIPLVVALYAVGCLGCTYYELGLRIPLLGELIASAAFKVIRRFLMQGFGYFACGYIVHKLQKKAQYIYIYQGKTLSRMAERYGAVAGRGCCCGSYGVAG